MDKTKKNKIILGISLVGFIVSMFFPSFQGIDIKVFDYTKMNYFELVKEKWWIYVLLLIILVLTRTLSIEKSKILSSIFVSGFIFFNLSLLSLENSHLFINGSPVLWGYAVATLFGLLVSFSLLIDTYKDRV